MGMGKRKTQTSGCSWALLAFFVIAASGQFAPIIAFVVGIAGIIYVIRRLGGINASTPPSLPRQSISPGQEFRIREFGKELTAVQKKMIKPGRWKTQIERIREASGVKTRIERAAANAGTYAHAYRPLITAATDSIAAVARIAIPELNRHFVEQTEKLQGMSSQARVAKAATTLLDQLTDLSKVDPIFVNIAATLALPIRELSTSAHQANTIKSRLTTAQTSERAGQRNEAIGEYLNLLYDLKTDNIDDDNQISEIADLENRVRRVVRSYANASKRKKTNRSQEFSRPQENA